MITNEDLDGKHIGKIEKVNFQPIFILGLPRSGTSILYKILTKTDNFNFVTPYHIINYHKLLHNHINNLENDVKLELNKSFNEKRLEDRGMDRLKISADFPEEYGYILINKTRQIRITPKTIQLFLEMAKKIQFISENNKPLLLKNPLDFQNIAYIKKKLPNAKFIFISRDPIKIFSSNMKAIQGLLKVKNLYTIQIFREYVNLYNTPLLRFLVGLFVVNIPIVSLIYLSIVYKKSTNRFIKDIKKLSSEDFTILRYEDLCEHPQNTIDEIMEFLKQKPQVKIDVKQFIKPRKTHLDSYIINMRSLISKQMKNYYDFFKYKKDDNIY